MSSDGHTMSAGTSCCCWWCCGGVQFALELKPSHKICVKYAKAGVASGLQDWGVGMVLYGSVKEWCVRLPTH